MPRIKVWSCNRRKKYAVTFIIEEDVEVVTKKGCEKLNCLVRKLVAEDDGTEVDNIDGLVYYSSIDNPILLLEEEEIWLPANMNLVHGSSGQGAEIIEQKGRMMLKVMLMRVS